MTTPDPCRIPEYRLAEQWYGLMHSVMAKLQGAFRIASRERGLTQRIIAKRLGMKNPEVVSRCLSGQKNMTLRTLHNLARAMDCRLDVSVTLLSSQEHYPPIPEDIRALAEAVFDEAGEGSLFDRVERALLRAREEERERWKAAATYFERYCQDEAEDDAVEWVGCSEQQHLDAKAFAASIREGTKP